MHKKESNYRVVLDTNLPISSVINPFGTPAQLYRLFTQHVFIWVLSPEIFYEIVEVLHRDKIRVKYSLSDTEIETMLTNISLRAEWTAPHAVYDLPLHSPDPKDDRFLACAISGECDYLVSGDKRHLLSLKGNPALGKLKIVTAREFLDLLAGIA